MSITKVGKPKIHVPGLSYWIGVNLAEARHGAKLTQEALAEKAGVTARTIQSLEADDATNATVKTLAALAKALGLEVIDLFKRSDDFVNV